TFPGIPDSDSNMLLGFDLRIVFLRLCHRFTYTRPGNPATVKDMTRTTINHNGGGSGGGLGPFTTVTLEVSAAEFASTVFHNELDVVRSHGRIPVNHRSASCRCPIAKVPFIVCYSMLSDYSKASNSE